MILFGQCINTFFFLYKETLLRYKSHHYHDHHKCLLPFNTCLKHVNLTWQHRINYRLSLGHTWQLIIHSFHLNAISHLDRLSLLSTRKGLDCNRYDWDKQIGREKSIIDHWHFLSFRNAYLLFKPLRATRPQIPEN